MAFTIAPKEGPARVEGVLNPISPVQSAAKERAIAKLLGQAPETTTNNAQTSPVQNPSQVGMEELSALKVPTQKDDNSITESTEAKPASEATEAPKQPPEEGQPLSSQFAQLARKEKALRAREIEIKRLEQEYKAQQGVKITQPTIDTSKYVDRAELEKNPFGVLAELGVSYEALTEMAANAPTSDQVAFNKTIAALEAKIATLEKGQDEFKKLDVEREQNSYKTALETIRRDVTATVKSNEAYETVRLSGSEGDVVELIEKTFHNGMGADYPKGTVLSVEEAAQIVENHLVEEAFNLVNKSKKLQSRLQPKPAETTAQKQPEPPKQSQPPMRTLTNSVGSSRQYSAKERAMFAAQHGPGWREKVGA